VSARLPVLALAYPCDALALQAALQIEAEGLARPLLVGPPVEMARAAAAADIDLRRFECVATGSSAAEAAQHAVTLARDGAAELLMKGSLHTDEMMSAVVRRTSGMRTGVRISHVFLLDLPRYPKLLALTDCAVNIAPSLPAKRAIVANAVQFLQKLGIAQPQVAVLAATEMVNPAMPATLDAQALVELARQGEWPGATVEGPFGFDNAFSAQAARIKHIESSMPGHADVLLVPDVNAGNLLYKACTYVAGGEGAGLVLGTRVPIAMTSRADSVFARVASVALAVLNRS
jgi:phosphate acetyltransferase/phosphate butyryltransferase